MAYADYPADERWGCCYPAGQGNGVTAAARVTPEELREVMFGELAQHPIDV